MSTYPRPDGEEIALTGVGLPCARIGRGGVCRKALRGRLHDTRFDRVRRYRESFCIMSAASPLTMGVAMLVPLKRK